MRLRDPVLPVRVHLPESDEVSEEGLGLLLDCLRFRPRDPRVGTGCFPRVKRSEPGVQGVLEFVYSGISGCLR